VSDPKRSRESAGVLFGLAAYTTWGVAPAYWRVVSEVSPVELLANRVFWSLAIAVVLLGVSKSFGTFRAAFATPRQVFPVAIAAFLLGGNWLVFIYAVSVDQVVATSLGYYLNPLLNVVLGFAVLGERLRPVQWVAVAIAATGIAIYVYTLGELPWISVCLAGSFALYGLVRKVAPVEPIVGFSIEMSVLFLPCLAVVLWLRSTGAAQLPFGNVPMDAYIAGSGIITALPLICFNAAAKRLPLVTVGILQYIAPSMTLGLAVLVWGEPFQAVHAWTFGAVGVALAIFTAEAIYQSRDARAT
jgi:chloramphenicol-sensitive protein RarD